MPRFQYLNHNDSQLLISDGPFLYVIDVYNFRGCIGGQDNSDKAWYISQLEHLSDPIEEDEDGVEMKIELKGENRFVLHDAKELYQFNCCKALFNQIKVLVSTLKPLGYTSKDFDRYGDTPGSLPSDVITNIKVTREDTSELAGNPESIYRIEFSFDYAGKTFTGSNAFCKYAFIQDMTAEINSLDDLFKVYVAINRMLAGLCRQYGDEDFLSCDDWARGA